MTANKFEKMATKKLQALLSTANDEDKALIEQVLASREEKPAQMGLTEYTSEEPLTAEEQAILDEAEKNGGINPAYNKKPKLTDDERIALAAECRNNVRHKCQVVPFNTAEWVDGVIVGVIEEKRVNKVLYAIKTNDGKRIVKVSDSPLIKILDEVVEKAAVARAAGEHKDPWTVEEANQVQSEMLVHVGKPVTWANKTQDAEGNEVVTEMAGRVTGIVTDRRSRMTLLRIEYVLDDVKKTMHKTPGSSSIILHELDEEGNALNKVYADRFAERLTREKPTAESRVLKCEANYKKALEQLERAKERLAKAEAELAEAKAAITTDDLV